MAADVRRCIMSRLIEAIAADHPDDYLRQSCTLAHLEHLVAGLSSLPQNQLHAIRDGLVEACRRKRPPAVPFRDEPDYTIDEAL